MSGMEFVKTYTKARNITSILMCYLAKIIGGTVMSPIGRIVLTPKDYKHMAIITGNGDLIDY